MMAKLTFNDLLKKKAHCVIKQMSQNLNNVSLPEGYMGIH